MVAAMGLLWLSAGAAIDDRKFWALAIDAPQLSQATTSLIPFWMKVGKRVERTDMYAILKVLCRPQWGTVDERQREVLRTVFPGDIPVPPPSPDSPEIVYQVTRQGLGRDLWIRRDASRVLEAVLDRGRMPPLERAFVLDRLTRWGLMDETSDVAVLDRWSGEAYALTFQPIIAVTRGGVLLRLGRFDEAEALLQSVAGQAEAGGRGKICDAYLRMAKAEKALAAAKTTPA